MTNPLRGLLFAAAFSGFCAGSLAAETVSLSLDKARRVAEQAIVAGQPKVALEIATGLLHADPKDSDTLLLISRAQAQLGNNRRGHKAARLAYRHGDTGATKLEAATWAGRHALQQERLTLTQIWLRRASLHASRDEDQTRIADEYRKIRAANPWSFRLNFGLTPSDNVNNGSDTDEDRINGIDTGGRFNGAAQALSGTAATLDLTMGYRLNETQRSRTTLAWRLYVRDVYLSSSAREKLADSTPLGTDVPSESDFDATYTELGVNHAFRIGETPGNAAQLTFALGGLWSGGEFFARSVRADAVRNWRLSDTRRLTLGGSLTRRDVDGSSRRDSLTFSLRGSVRQTLANGDKITFGAVLQDVDADFGSDDYKAAQAYVTYAFAEQIGPASIRASLQYKTADYDNYIVGLPGPGGVGVVPVSVERGDDSLFAELSLFFPDLDYAGFAPELTIRAGQRESNLSRFDSSQLSISLGIQSKF